jgi:hypothetical protein
MTGIFKTAILTCGGLLLAVSLVLTGCASKDPVAAEVLTKSMTAMQKVSSYSGTIDMKMDANFSSSGQTGTMSVDATGTTLADVTKMNTYSKMDMNVSILGQDPENIQEESYMADNWVYMKMSVPGAADTWTKTKSTVSLTQDQIAQLTNLMKNSISSSLVGTENVNGLDCYILKVDPDLTTLWQWLMAQQGSELSSLIDTSKLDLTKLIKDFGIKYWVAKNSYQIVKAEANMTMVLDASDLGQTDTGDGNMTLTMNMDMTFADYNKPVNIVVPVEALGASEITP